jgi:putative PEP-CTERM system TPR-repeat lipoprotein
MRNAPPRITLAGLALAALLAVSATPAHAQNAAARASQFYEDALQRFEKKDYAGAVVQLKNVLRLDNRNLSAQVLLGRALLEDGQVNAAEVAFTEAIRLGVNRAEVVVPMATAAMRQGKPDQLLSDARFAVEGLPRQTQFELLLLRAAAAGDTGDLRAALKAIDDARALNASAIESFLAEVPLRIRGRQLREALAAADRAASLDASSAKAHYSRGEVLHVMGDAAKARAAYDRAIQIEPDYVDALVARAGIALDQGRLAEVQRDIDAALRKTPREPRATFLRATVAEREGRAADARAALNEVTTQLDPIPPQFLRFRPQLLLLGGLAHHGLGQREKAKPYLEGVLRGDPGHPSAKVLASMHLADRSPDAAILVLDAYLRQAPGDVQAQVLLANAHLGQGRAARAVQILQDALKRGDSPALRTSLGLAHVGAGRVTEAIRELEAAYAKDPLNLQAGYALGSLYVQTRQAGPAQRVAQSLEKAFPARPEVLTLGAQARGLRGDLAGAQTALDAALKADPAHVPAQIETARLAMARGDHARAARALDAVLARDDKNSDAVAALAELSERTGKLGDAERWLMRGDEIAGGSNPAPALALVEFHLRQQQVPKAQEALRRAQAKAPDAVSVLVATARVALAAGDATQARSQLGRAATAAGFNVPQLVQIAGLQLVAGQPQAAGHSLDKALNERPNHLPALAIRAEVDILLGELASAEQRIRRVLAAAPRSGLGHTLAGNLAEARRQPEAALAAYRKAHELDRNGASFLRVFIATVRRDRPAAIRLAEQWVATNPRDAQVWRVLGDTQLDAGNAAAARRSYEEMVKLGTRDADALNNLAHALISLKDPGALRVAEQALAVAPGAAHVIGTTGWAAFKAGQNDRAIQLLRDARLRDPGNADTRFYLASVLAAMGRNGEARTELNAALLPDSQLSYRADAQALLGSLR